MKGYFGFRLARSIDKILYYSGIKKITKRQMNYILYFAPTYNRSELEKFSRIEASNLIDKLSKSHKSGKG